MEGGGAGRTGRGGAGGPGTWSERPATGAAQYRLRLTFHVGGWLGDPDASTALPADFQVDYVRMYQRAGRPIDPAPGIAALPPGALGGGRP